MADFLSRNMAPLTPDQWQLIDNTVVQMARASLVGRKFIPLFGPLGPGLQTITTEVYTGASVGYMDMMGEGPQNEIVRMERRNFVPLPIIYKDFRLHWRDIEESERFGISLDTSVAAAAASFCARAEDNLIFNGNPDQGYEGLLNATDRTILAQSDWGQMGEAFGDVVAATEALIANGFFGPYALIVSPLMHANMNRVYENSGVLELEQVRKIATAGVFQTPLLPEPSAIVVSTGPQNLDLVLGQDFSTAFLQTQDMNHYFRVFEILALRIKRPGAICTLEGQASPRRGRRRRETEPGGQTGGT